ncbi:MAG: hypothetical protein FWD53_03015 [Phycisphaerales bacterium]|nr:hypothetical protein [Phycisphaerales bacterium]
MNDEIRMTNNESNSNVRMTNVRNNVPSERFGHLSIRHSSFVIRHSRAFTLLELVLALAISVGVTVILGSSLYTAFRTKGIIEQSVDAIRASGTAVDILAREIPLALPPTPNNDESDQLQSVALIGPFQGDEQSLSFFISGNEPKADLQGDIREVVYMLVPNANAPVTSALQLLIRRVQTNLLHENPDIPADEIIAKDVLNFTLKYYDGSEWYETWDSEEQENRLPMAVEFTLELAPLRDGLPNRIETRIVPLPLATAGSDSSGSGGLLQ